MPISLLQIIILGLIQGAAELLPVSSSAHVIVAEKLMGLDPTSPEMTFLLIMLHTGTMFAVLVYFWKAWRESYFASGDRFRSALARLVIATAATGVVYLALKWLIEHVFLAGRGKAEIEDLFGRLPLIASALAAVGLLILAAGIKSREERAVSNARLESAGDRRTEDNPPQPSRGDVTPRSALGIGLVQGFCIPIRGLSRSGATISTALLCGVGRRRAEEFSFALAVILTPPAIVRELHRLLKIHAAEAASSPLHLSLPGLFGMLCSFIAGLVALRLLSRWLEGGKWSYFGCYCLAAAVIVFGLWRAGY